ncbi:IS1595 family transposase [Roseimicrobium sp. ORNL1]|uniref:IS1595 family transposase n=1 Tax=Roseimicrobium sp. ORNL1 TaxID=2711231 RepID=UPI0023F58722|nr:IS1595 family transposase [Roseimicrobium sp. ORNL1]
MQGTSFRAGLLRCRACEKQFSVTIGTIFEDSHVPLAKWIRAFHLMCSSKKGISSLQLQRNLGLGSYRTAWHMTHRIRLAMKCEPFAGLLKGTVQADETYVGGKSYGQGKGKGMENKTIVVSLLQNDGPKRSYIIHKANAHTIKALITENVEKGSNIHTDEFNSYKNLKSDYKHMSVNHAIGQYVRNFKDGSKVTTNTVEGSFSLLKRGIYGTFHSLSKHHLHRYLAEFDFRWNERKATDVERTTKALLGTKGVRLSYKPLIDRTVSNVFQPEPPVIKHGKPRLP